MARQKGQSNNKRRSETPRKQQERLDIIADLYKHGYTYRQIRLEVMNRLALKAYSLQSVHADIQKLLAEWRSYRVEIVDHNIQLELERIDEMIKESWESWEKSKEDYVKEHAKQIALPVPPEDDGEGGDRKPVVVRMEQSKENVKACGDVRYLDLINKLLVERRKLLGLYAPEQKEITNKFSSMSKSELDKAIKDLERQLS